MRFSVCVLFGLEEKLLNQLLYAPPAGKQSWCWAGTAGGVSCQLLLDDSTVKLWSTHGQMFNFMIPQKTGRNTQTDAAFASRYSSAAL